MAVGKDIASKRDQMETIQAQLNSCLHFVVDHLKTGSQGEVLKMKTTIVQQVKELTTPVGVGGVFSYPSSCQL